MMNAFLRICRKKKRKIRPDRTMWDDVLTITNKSSVAESSRLARQKRKQEVSGLVEENKKLRQERAEFIARIEKLTAAIQELREKGDIDVHLENELLKAQLEEHSLFVVALRQMANGIPTSETAKNRIYKKGADFAVNHVLSVLRRSVDEKPKWIVAHPLNGDLKQIVQVSFRYARECETSKILHVRIDHSLESSVDINQVSELYWRLWNSPEVTRQFFEQSHTNYHKSTTVILDRVQMKGCHSSGMKTAEIYHTSDPLQGKQHIITSYVHERNEFPTSDNEWAFVATRMTQEISDGLLEQNGSSSNNVSRYCVMARSTSSHLPSTSDIPRIKAMYAEGCICWKEKSTCRITSILSISEAFSQRWLDGPTDVITHDGFVSDKFQSYLNAFRDLLHHSIN